MWRSRLFWRFFLSIMLVVLLTSAVSIAFEKYLREQQSAAHTTRTVNQLVDFRHTLTLALEVDDSAEVRDVLNDNPDFKHQFFVFDAYGNEILGRKQWLKRPFRGRFDHPLIAEFRARQLPLFTEVIGYSGETYYLELNPKMDFMPLFSPRLGGVIVRALLWVLLAGLACYFLTRTLTRQIRRLQWATHQLAEGDFRGAFPPDYRFSKDELGQLGQDFQRMAQQLDDSQRARKQMLSDISHELRSPLARMQVALEIARTRLSHSPPANNGAQLDRLETEIVRLNSLIGQIIHIQQLQLNDGQAFSGRIAIAPLLTTIITDVNYEYQQQDKRAVVRVSEPADTVIGDADLLHSALENVIRNALSHTPEQSSVEVIIHQDEQYIVITVTDSGKGIDETDKQRIFQPFVRLDSSRNRQTGGYGLGLAIAKAVIERHGGRISAENAAEGGLCVMMAIPKSKKD